MPPLARRALAEFTGTGLAGLVVFALVRSGRAGPGGGRAGPAGGGLTQRKGGRGGGCA